MGGDQEESLHPRAWLRFQLLADYAYYEYFSKETGVIKQGECLRINLSNNDDFHLYSFVPPTNGAADFGRTDLFMGIGLVE